LPPSTANRFGPLTRSGRSNEGNFAGTGRGTGFTGPNKELTQGKARQRQGHSQITDSRRIETERKRLGEGCEGQQRGQFSPIRLCVRNTATVIPRNPHEIRGLHFKSPVLDAIRSTSGDPVLLAPQAGGVDPGRGRFSIDGREAAMGFKNPLARMVRI
jgi:hypothetical protein